jgi:pimeloyl-ACP methyl ester carboxylesterase
MKTPPAPAFASLDLGARRLSVLDLRGPGASVTLLGVHGWGGSALEYAPLAAELPRGVGVIAPDMPGTGESSPVAFDEYGTELFVSTLRELVARKSLAPVVLAGHSLGCKTAVSFAARHPEAVKALVLFAPYGLAGQEGAFRRAAASRAWVARLGARLNNRLVIRWSLRHRVYWDSSRIPAELVGPLIANQLSRGGREAFAAVAHAMVGRDPIDDLLPGLSVPTLLVWGREDRSVPASAAARYAAALPRARLELLDRCGHVPMVERPVEAAALLAAFLRENGLLE